MSNVHGKDSARDDDKAGPELGDRESLRSPLRGGGCGSTGETGLDHRVNNAIESKSQALQLRVENHEAVGFKDRINGVRSTAINKRGWQK